MHILLQMEKEKNTQVVNQIPLLVTYHIIFNFIYLDVVFSLHPIGFDVLYTWMGGVFFSEVVIKSAGNELSLASCKMLHPLGFPHGMSYRM